MGFCASRSVARNTKLFMKKSTCPQTWHMTIFWSTSEFPSDEWNIYVFHFSDGDNWSMDDTMACVELLKARVLPVVNMFAYGQVESPYGSGQFLKDLKEHLGTDPRVVTSEIKDKDGIVNSIKDFLGKGR